MNLLNIISKISPKLRHNLENYGNGLGSYVISVAVDRRNLPSFRISFALFSSVFFTVTNILYHVILLRDLFGRAIVYWESDSYFSKKGCKFQKRTQLSFF